MRSGEKGAIRPEQCVTDHFLSRDLVPQHFLNTRSSTVSAIRGSHNVSLNYIKVRNSAARIA
jgi:hypothetical protein